MTNTNTYDFTCAKCGDNHSETWSDSKTKKEYEDSSWFLEGDIIDIICDNCFLDFKRWVEQLTPAQHARIRESAFENQQLEDRQFK